MSQATDHKGKEEESNYLILPLIISVMGCIAIGLVLVWLNIERTKIAYNIRNLQNEESVRKDLNANLLIERENLLSPHALGDMANRIGLYTAKPGQVRRMDLMREVQIETETEL